MHIHLYRHILKWGNFVGIWEDLMINIFLIAIISLSLALLCLVNEQNGNLNFINAENTQSKVVCHEGRLIYSTLTLYPLVLTDCWTRGHAGRRRGQERYQHCPKGTYGGPSLQGLHHSVEPGGGRTQVLYSSDRAFSSARSLYPCETFDV